jgi:hypothetical protein
MHNFSHSIASMHKYRTLDHGMNQKLGIELSQERKQNGLFQIIFIYQKRHDVKWSIYSIVNETVRELSLAIQMEVFGFLLNTELGSND